MSHVMMRQAQHLQHEPPSSRRELQSHPLAGQAQACGRLTKGGKAGGPDGTYRDHWCFHRRKKKPFSHVILVLEAMSICSVSSHGRSTNCACHPCAQAMQCSPYREQILRRGHAILQPVTTFLELCVSTLRRGHAAPLRNSICACRPCTRAMQKSLSV